MVRARWAAAAVVALIVLAPARPAFAHAGLDATTPAANSVLDDAPPAIVLDFNENIDIGLASVHLFRGDSSEVPLGDPARGADGSIVTVPMPALDPDVYAVVWHVASEDGHVVDGAFSFQIGSAIQGDGDALIASVRQGVKASPAVRWWAGVARFVGYVAFVVMIGAGWWIAVAGRLGVAVARMRRLVPIASGLFVAAAGASFVLFGAEALAGSIGDAFSPSVWNAVADSRTGALLKARFGFAAAWCALVAGWSRLPDRWRTTIGGALAAATLYTFSAVGHPSAHDPSSVWITVDMVHLAAIAVWLGGLLVLAVAPATALADEPGRLLARRFSRVALVALPLTVLTGVVNALKIGGGIDRLDDTEWGRQLILKAALVAVVVVLAALSRFVLMRRSPSLLRGSVIGEVVVGIVVIALAASIVTLPPEPPRPQAPFAAQLASAQGVIAVVSISPGSVGSNEVHLFITPPGGSIVPVLSAEARVSLVGTDLAAVPMTLRLEGPNHYQGTVTFPRNGEWRLELIVQITEGQQQSLVTTVPIP